MKINNKKLIKNYLFDSLIKKMYENCFNLPSDNIKITKLHGGLKNAVYLIENDFDKVVLKVSPKVSTRMISADKNNMWWEAKMLKIMNKLGVPAPQLILYDNSGKICQEDYIFMSYISGQVYSEAKKDMSTETKNNIEYQIGKISSIISSIKSNNYFISSFPNIKFKNNYEFVYYLFDMLIMDINNNKLNIDCKIITKVYNILKSNEVPLNDVDEISLCDADIWDGNILVEDERISGIVDFADLYFCDKLMTFYFHTIDGVTKKSFLEGFNKKDLSANEEIRIEIYRLYVILKMIVDCELKNYGKFEWMYQIFDEIVEKLKTKN